MKINSIINLFKVDKDINLEKPEFEYKENQIKKILKKICINLLAFGMILLLWYIIAQFVIYTRGVPFPTPQDTFSRLYELLTGVKLYDKTIYDHLLASLRRWGTGYILAVIFGIFIGLALGASKTLHDIFMPTVYVIQLIPGLAWIPIALLIFGLGDTSTIFMIFAMGITPIIINTAGGIKSTPIMYVRASQMMGASKLTIFFSVMLPASTISIINGLRIGLANAWRVLIAAEMIVGVGIGLGYSIIQARWSLDFEAAFVCIVIICFIGLVIEKFVFVVIEKKAMERMGLSKES